MSIGPLQLLLIVLIVLLLFGSKKLGNIGADLSKAIQGFKKGMRAGDEDKDTSASQEQLKADEAPAATSQRPASAGAAASSTDKPSAP